MGLEKQEFRENRSSINEIIFKQPKNVFGEQANNIQDLWKLWEA